MEMKRRKADGIISMSVYLKPDCAFDRAIAEEFCRIRRWMGTSEAGLLRACLANALGAQQDGSIVATPFKGRFNTITKAE
jgi:predicted RNase H-like nuclease